MFREFARRALLSYATRVPYHRGKWRVIESALRMSGIEEADRGRTFEVERDGVKWRLGTECRVQRKLYYHGELDPYDVRELLTPPGSGSVFFDIGSYFGYYALLAARRGARAFAFEPAAANYQLLAAHQAMNGFDRLQTFQLALSDEVGSVAFASPVAENRGTGRMLPGETAGAGTETVAMTTLDAFAAGHGIDRLDALKLDVEGAEVKVLAGGRATLARLRPAMLIELNPPCLARFGASEAQLLAAVRDLGYTVWRATAGGRVKYERLAPGEAYTNILCLPA